MTSKEALKRLCSCSMLKHDTTKQYAEVIENDLEVLEILKNKKVDIVRLSMCDCVEMYNCYFKYATELRLTKEEFNKIKEWLKNDTETTKDMR